jgi:hypothetical protein
VAGRARALDVTDRVRSGLRRLPGGRTRLGRASYFVVFAVALGLALGAAAGLSPWGRGGDSEAPRAGGDPAVKAGKPEKAKPRLRRRRGGKPKR